MSSLGPVDYALLIADLSIEVCALAILVKKRALSHHFTLVLFLCASIAIGIGRYAVLTANGFTSNTYLYFYFFSDALLIICLYFVLMSLYLHVFSEMNAGKMVRAGALLLLAGTALISYYMVATSTDRLVTKFVMEMAQNLYFVGVVLTYLLWGAMMKLRENRSRVMQLVLSMGVYFSAFAGSFALGNLYPDLVIWRYVSHLMVTWLPISWAYTFVKVSEDARMATARVVAPTQ
jgi:hypothetical protein